jgi:hypothetical protein
MIHSVPTVKPELELQIGLKRPYEVPSRQPTSPLSLSLSLSLIPWMDDGRSLLSLPLKATSSIVMTHLAGFGSYSELLLVNHQNTKKASEFQLHLLPSEM